jgi:hypothetical protein
MKLLLISSISSFYVFPLIFLNLSFYLVLFHFLIIIIVLIVFYIKKINEFVLLKFKYILYKYKNITAEIYSGLIEFSVFDTILYIPNL